MACQICGEKSGFYPLCKACNKLKEDGKVTKCQECGKWKKDDKPLCYDCWLRDKKNREKGSKAYKASDTEKDEINFRDKFPAKIIAEDGHRVRSRGELAIDNWLYHKGIVHAYERRVPIGEDLYCDFFIPLGQKVYIEFWGLEDKKYVKRKELKKNLYKKYNKNLIELTNDDAENLDDVLPVKLMKYLPSTFSFD